MSGINPVAVGIGAGIVASLGTGYGLSKITDGIAAEHPTGSDADGGARAWTIGGALGGLAIGGGAGTAALLSEHVGLAAGLFGLGAGVMIGALGAGLLFDHRHGVGVDTQVSDVFGDYDRNDDGELRLDGSFWHPREDERSYTTTSTVNGTTTYDYHHFDVHALAAISDVNHDRIASRGEIHDKVASYDLDGDGRLRGEENKRYDREVGERGA